MVDRLAMVYAEFEEKQYEFAANLELARGGTGVNVFPPGQVLENLVGYDSVAHPSSTHRLWSVLKVPRPKGIRLLPAFWPAGSRPAASKLPAACVGMVLQYKRPEYLRADHGRHKHLWPGTAYYRYKVDAHQQDVLADLEMTLGKFAVVRYASPAFHSYAELEIRQVGGTVLEGSGYLSPALLKGHAVWTYPGPGTFGRGNPDGEEIEFSSFEGLASSVERALEGGGQSLLDQAKNIGRAAAEVDLHNGWGLQEQVTEWGGAVISALGDLSRDHLQALECYVLAQSLLGKVGSQVVFAG